MSIMAPPARSNWYLMSDLLTMGAHSHVSMWRSRPSSPLSTISLTPWGKGGGGGGGGGGVAMGEASGPPRAGGGRRCGRAPPGRRLFCVGGEGLLAQHVLPSREGG